MSRRQIRRAGALRRLSEARISAAVGVETRDRIDQIADALHCTAGLVIREAIADGLESAARRLQSMGGGDR